MGGKHVQLEKDALIAAINEAENKETFKNISALCKSVGATLGISPIIIPSRIKQWNIQIKTQKGRLVGDSKVVINKKQMLATIAEVEKDGGLKNIGDLCAKVSEIMGIKAHNVSNFIRDEQPEIKTKKGKRGGKGRTKAAPVDSTKEKQELIEAINEIEQDGPLSSLGELNKAVGIALGIHPAQVGFKIKEYGIQVKTQPSQNRGKVRIELNKEQLSAAINEAEKHGALPTMSILLTKLSESLGVSTATIINRIKEYGLQTRTQSAAKGQALKVDVNKDELIAAIAEVEENGPYSNFAELCNDVSQLMTDQKVSPAIVRARILEWELPIKTATRRKEKSDEAKLTKPVEAPDIIADFVIVPSEDAVESYLGKFSIAPRPVFCPDGKCPIKLLELEESSVYEWIREVQDYGLRQGKFYQPTAYVYFAREFVDIHNKEKFSIVKELIAKAWTKKPLEEAIEI